MSKLGFKAWIGSFFNGSNGKKGQNSHTGLIFGAIVTIATIILMASGLLRGIDDYLNALVFQAGYQPPKSNDQLIVVKKDQATSELLGKNPDRSEFASIFSFLGQPQVVERKKDVKPFGMYVLRVNIGLFQGLKELPFKLGYLDWAGFVDKDPAAAAASSAVSLDPGKWLLRSQQIKNGLRENPQHPGFTSLIQVEGRTWPPTGPSFFKLFAGGKEPLIFPTMLFPWADKVFQQAFQLAVTDREGEGATAVSGQIASALRLMERWQTLLANFGSIGVDLDFRYYPKPGTAISMILNVHTSGVPREYLVEPAAAVGFDFVLQGGKDKALDSRLQKTIEAAGCPIILAGHTKIEEEFHYDETTGDHPAEMSNLSRTRLAVRMILPDASFLRGRARIAYIDMSAGNKSYVTEAPLFVANEAQNRIEPSFSLMMAMLALDARHPDKRPSYVDAMDGELQRILPEVASNTFRGPLRINELEIPVNSQGRMLLNYVGSTSRGRFDAAAIRSASFYECFERSTLNELAAMKPGDSRLTPEVAHRNTLDPVKGKGGRILIAGPFEVSDFDYFSTPLSLDTPLTIQKDPLMGIEIHANAIINILEQRYIKHPSYWHAIMALLVSSLLLGFLLDIMSPIAGAFLTLAFLLGSFWHAYSSYHVARQLFIYSPLVVSYPAIWALATLTNYIRQRARAQSTKEMFSRFVAADVVQYMLDNPELVRPGGEKVELTIFFSDVAGFTSISEALTPEELVVLLNEYLGAMTDLLFQYGGTLDKFIGDAVMAFWNFPRKQEDHAVRACLCALAMQRKINELQIGWAARGLPRVAARAGINTAGVVVGYMGSQKAQMNFTCMGDGVNLASRLEGANKEYGTMMMASDATFQKVKHVITGRFLDFLAVKGKKEPVKVFELISEKGHEPQGWFELAALYDKAIQLHLDRQWDEAIATFEQILVRWPGDGPSATYIKRCQEYKEAPPPEGWDGRYILTHK